MPRKKLTPTTIEKAQPQGQRTEIWDTQVPGLGLRITERGRKSFVVMYRIKGRKRRLTLGRCCPGLELEDARSQARDALNKVAKGQDPAEKSQPKAFEEVVEEYLQRDAKKNRSYKETRQIVENELLPRWREREIGDLTRKDVLRVTDAIVDRGATTQANRVFALIRRFFNWCVERGYIDISPANGLKKPTQEKARERVLTDDEIRVFWEAARRIGYPFGHLVRFMLVTAQRRGEVAGLRWSDISNGQWLIPADRAKNGRSHTVPLPSLAADLLAECPQDRAFVFSHRSSEPYNGFSKGKVRLDRVIGEVAREWGWEEVYKEPWSLHDLRRTAASGMAGQGAPPHVIEAVLNHVNGQVSGVAAVYNRYSYDEEKSRALTIWETALKRQHG